jgi:uncharacterized protein (DUF1800 family)
MGRMRSLACLALLSTVSAACGGGGGGGPDFPPTAPHDLAYSTAQPTYETNVAIAPNLPTTTGGAVESYDVVPALPAGLSLDPATGVISGTPTAPAPATNHVVTASNADGWSQATVRVTVALSAEDSLAPKSTYTDDDIRHFLGRTQLGFTQAAFDAVKAVGLPAYVDQMTTFSPNASLEAAADAYLLNENDDPALPGGFPSQDQLVRRWLYLLLNNPNPFQEVLALFWHDHFATSTDVLDGSQMHWMKAQVDLWRTKGNGNLRTLLIDMSRDWVMLKFLTGVDNVDGRPNENFAREFWELFTVGVDNGYTQADIVEAARAFTGYRVRFDDTTGQSFVSFSTSRHDGGAKTILGATIPAQDATDDYVAVVDITLANLQVAEFVSKKLFEHFAYAGPGALPIASMAQTMRGGSWELAPVLRALFKSRAFFSPRAKAGLVKSPVEHVLGFVRATGLVPINNKDAGAPASEPENSLSTLHDRLGSLAHQPTRAPSVNGWPVTEQWLSAQNMLDRGNAILSCITDRTDQTNAGIDVTTLLPPVGNRTAPEVVDALALRLRVVLPPQDRQTCIDYLNTDRQSNGTVISSPFDATNATHVSSRVRGLLYVLSLHPTYSLR